METDYEHIRPIELKRIVRGYPTTKTAEVHRFLEWATQFKTFKTENGRVELGWTEGADVLENECLEMIRAWALNWYKNSPQLAEKFKKKLPFNLFAISFAAANFEVGDSCQEYKLHSSFKQPETAYFYHRKLSECLQCTYYNEYDIEYLAGVTYHPVQGGDFEGALVDNHKALLEFLNYSIPYPPVDRRETPSFKEHNCYKQFCKTLEKWVVIHVDPEDGIPRHYDFNHETKTHFKTECEECLDDYETYKWKQPKEDPKRVKKFLDQENELKFIKEHYPTTKTPFVHDNVKHAVNWKTFSSSVDDRTKLGLTYGPEGANLVQKDCLEMIRKHMWQYYDYPVKYPELAHKFKERLPTNLLAVSYAEFNFEVGDSCQEFKLLAKFKQPETAFYSYRKLSESIQCTYYNENGIEYLAGVCYYPTPHGRYPLVDCNRALLNLIYPTYYPPQDRQKTVIYMMYGRYPHFCKTEGKNLVIEARRLDVPMHYGFNYDTERWFRKYCEQCRNDHYAYKWEEPKNEPSATLEPATEPSDGIADDFEKISINDDGEIVE